MKFFVAVLLFLIMPCPLPAEELYSFDFEEFEKKSVTMGGYGEVKWEHMDINQNGALSLLSFYNDRRSQIDRFTGTLQLNGNFNKGIVDFNWLAQVSGQQDQLGWYDNADIFTAYASIKPMPAITLDLGKKVFKWGKGYAWNPVGFIDRPKDPNNPEEAMEGYIGTGLDLIKSFSGSLQTAALTTVVLPVSQGVNEDFGETNNINLAAKLYLLYRDTDIDFVWYSGNSRSTRYGFDFSKNLATNFEIHGEFAHIPKQNRLVLQEDGSITTNQTSASASLIGLRYLMENDLTSIIEYYHNNAGYSEIEMERFFQLIVDGNNQFINTAQNTLLQKAEELNLRGYGRPQPGRNYLYTRFTQKEPFDILYFTPGLTAIFNLDDSSYSLTPEIVYTGFTNLELRMRFTTLEGPSFSEYGEKLNSNKFEVRLRYFF